MSNPDPPKTRDGFHDKRESGGVFVHNVDGERIPLILRHRDVRAAARDWQTFSSDAPFRVPIPSEERVRSVRQIPIELDPPQHTAYRKLLEPWFLRPTKTDYLAALERLIATCLFEAVEKHEIEVMSEFALPLQSRALALLLGMPEEESERWIGWGNSMYREGDGGEKGAQLDAYVRSQIANARGDVGRHDFFAMLTNLQLDGRPLSEDELAGIANLVFAGGRDTVINAIAEIIAYFVNFPDDADRVIQDPGLINGAVEEFVRFISPLSFIGRVCPNGAEIEGISVEPDARVGLCWASANHDAEVFEEPHSFQMARKPNPHMGFGSGKHACLGAAHARAVLRVLVKQIAPLASSIRIIREDVAFEDFGETRRRLGFQELVLRFA